MKNKRILLIVLCLFAVTLFFTGCAEKIDVSTGLSVEFSGTNGYGKASITGKDAWTKNFKSGDDMKTMAKVVAVSSAVEYKLSKANELSNGDKVVLEVVADNEALKQYNLSVKGFKKTFTVSGLPEAQEIDIFAGMTIKYDGYAPFATASASNNGKYNINIRYKLSKKAALSNGDKIVATAEFDETELAMIGYKAKETEKEIIVSGIEKTALMTFDQLSSSSKNALCSSMEDKILSRLNAEDTRDLDSWAYLIKIAEGNEKQKSHFSVLNKLTLNDHAESLENTIVFQEGNNYYWYFIYKIDMSYDAEKSMYTLYKDALGPNQSSTVYVAFSMKNPVLGASGFLTSDSPRFVENYYTLSYESLMTALKEKHKGLPCTEFAVN